MMRWLVIFLIGLVGLAGCDDQASTPAVPHPVIQDASFTQPLIAEHTFTVTIRNTGYAGKVWVSVGELNRSETYIYTDQRWMEKNEEHTFEIRTPGLDLSGYSDGNGMTVFTAGGAKTGYFESDSKRVETDSDMATDPLRPGLPPDPRLPKS